MTDSTEMLRLIRHAADRLAEEDPTSMFLERIGSMSSQADRTRAVRALMSLRVAMGYAESMLRMVAACMGVGEPTVPPPPSLGPGAFDVVALFAALDARRESEGLSWRMVADRVGVSASTFTRLGHGQLPAVDSLAALLAWLGTTDLAPFLVREVTHARG